MTQRKTHKKSTGRKRASSQPSTKKTTSSNSRKKQNGSGGNFGWLLLALFVVATGIIGAISIRNLYSENIADGVLIDNIDISGMTKEEAHKIVEEASQEKLENISVTFTYEDKSWHFGAEELQATINIDDIVDQAYETGHQGNFIERFKAQQDIKSLGAAIDLSITINKIALVDALSDVRREINNPMVEASIDFDPTDYDFFEDKKTPDVDMSREMFTIKEGSIGYEMDYDSALQQLNDALAKGWNADIEVTAKLTHPQLTAAELEEATTLIFHSSSKISAKNKENINRNSNIAKAIGHYKGLAVYPGETISYNEILGERTLEDGWLEAPTITREKILVDALGGGICQASTTIFNAAFMSGAKIIDRGPHSWPAYYLDFGYGMDAMVNWGTDDFIFINDSDYPIFFNTYFWYDTYGKPGYIDVDVYTMPQKDEDGNRLHIRPEWVKEEDTPPGEPIIREDTENEFLDKEWVADFEKGTYTYTYRQPRNTVKIRVFKVYYKDCIETEPGIWEDGVEVKREESHFDTYTGVAAIIYVKPIPVATPTPEPTPDGGASG
ncbi:MAG: VanW family protein [Clostridiales bacterium]|nr:VanW family protein [Clostridiales bacterium]